MKKEILIRVGLVLMGLLGYVLGFLGYQTGHFGIAPYSIILGSISLGYATSYRALRPKRSRIRW